jgi:hydroxyacylglutathione hydrolase
MALEEGARGLEDIENLLLRITHDFKVSFARKKTKSIYVSLYLLFGNWMTATTVPIEDEVGDVLEKAMRQEGRFVDEIAQAVDIPLSRLRDALDYRSELTCAELGRLARVLQLNEVGLCALGENSYPLPICSGLPFVLHALRMRHGVGVVNAYVISAVGAERGILFDTGPNLAALLENWPPTIKGIDSVFLTHIEGEHTGGLCDVVDYFGIKSAFVPHGCHPPCGEAIGDAVEIKWANIKVQAFSTPGHASAHNCYRISVANPTGATALLIAGDLIFAGSVGGSYFSSQLHRKNLRRILNLCAADTILAPGHGPLTSVGNELRYNPFLP